LSNNQPETIDWGLTPYNEALERQLDLVKKRIEGATPDTLIFTEHPPVFTIGKRKGAESHLLWEAEELEKKGIEVQHTNRGGDITYHGPGQIVGYSIISLHDKKDLHLYLRNLEQVLINALNRFGLKTGRNPGKTGIWIENRKIAAMGVAVKSWITYHGFALNVKPDLSHFSGIISCGISPEEGLVTSMELELGKARSELDLTAVKDIIKEEFWRLFTE